MPAIILEADMGKDAYYRTKDEYDTKKKLNAHIKKQLTCIKMIELMNQTILLGKDKEMMSIEKMKEFVIKIKF